MTAQSFRLPKIVPFLEIWDSTFPLLGRALHHSQISAFFNMSVIWPHQILLWRSLPYLHFSSPAYTSQPILSLLFGQSLQMPAVFLLSHLLPPGLITLKENQKYKQIISTKRMYINSTKNEGLWSQRDPPYAWVSHSFFPFSNINLSKLVHSSNPLPECSSLHLLHETKKKNPLGTLSISCCCIYKHT